MRDVFNSIPVPSVGRNYFNLSHSRHFDCDAGQIIPTLFIPFIPGDHFKISNNIVVRPQPMVTPIMSETNVFTYYFAVSNRILLGEMIDNEEGFKQWEIADRRWEKFISGGVTGNLTSSDISIPRWLPSLTPYYNDNFIVGSSSSAANEYMSLGNTSRYSLWDYFGFPIEVGAFSFSDDRVLPLIFPKRAYNMVYNWFFRDKNLEPNEVDLDSDVVQNCCWAKDYFTSSLPWTQRGTSDFLALPVNISSSDNSLFLNHSFYVSGILPNNFEYAYNSRGLGDSEGKGPSAWSDSQSVGLGVFGPDIVDPKVYFTPGSTGSNLLLFKQSTSQGGGVDYDSGSIPNPVSVATHEIPYSQIARNLVATTFDINDLRLASRVQQWLERNAIAGAEYSEFILAHFGVAPRDDRLQKPLFLGSSKNPLWISEVLQTSAPISQDVNGSPLGTLGGHGLTAGRNYICRYSAKEFGYIIGLTIIKPKLVMEHGVPRWLQYNDRFEYPFPEFAHLGEQDIRNSEIGIFGSEYDIDSDTGEPKIFGFTGRFNELRYMDSILSGSLRSSGDLSQWIWSRYMNFTPQIDGSLPALNKDFVKMRPNKSIFAVQNEPSFVCSIGNIVDAWRPLPKYPTPEVI